MSLFRYNGGKSKLAEKILAHIDLVDHEGTVYAEPFVGGGSIALTVAARFPKVKLVLNDLDRAMYSFWNLLASGSDDEFLALRQRVQECQPTMALYNKLQATEPTDPIDRAFRTLFFNRTSFSSSNGKRPLGGWKQGENGAIDSRWNVEALVPELTNARMLLADRTAVFNEDFGRVLEAAQKNWVMYLDPPYYKAGNQLYNIPWEDCDHVRLCEALKKTPADWVLSYDYHPRIVELYNHGMTRSMPMPASYSISKRPEVEAIFVPAKKVLASRDYRCKGFVAPKNFTEFYERYPDFVRQFVSYKMHFSAKRRDENSTFRAQIEDYTQDLLLFLSALPKCSKYRAKGFTDPIQLFNHGLWGNITQQKFHLYVKMILSNKFHTLRTGQFKDALPHAEEKVGTIFSKLVSFPDECTPDIGVYRKFVAEYRPNLLPAFDRFFDPPDYGDTRNREHDNERTNLVHLLRERFVHGNLPRRKRKAYKKRTPKKVCTETLISCL